jgi:hypothetical protein
VTYLKDKLEKLIPYLKKKISKNVEKRMPNSTLNLIKQIQNEDVPYQVMQNELVQTANKSIETYIKLFPESPIAILAKQDEKEKRQAAEKAAAKISNTSSEILLKNNQPFAPVSSVFSGPPNVLTSGQPPPVPPSAEKANNLAPKIVGDQELQNIPSNGLVGPLRPFTEPTKGNSRSQLNNTTSYL